MKIFISYGHDDYAFLADMLYDRLSAITDERGEKRFTVHKDNRGAIKEAQLWDRELESALSDSEYVIFLMSSYSTRSGSVCLDEIAYARNRGGINIIPVRLDNISSPLLICRLQYINWLEKPENFEAVFECVLGAVEHYDSVIRNSGQGVIYDRLFKTDFFCERRNIVGREDVLQECESFISGDRVGPLVISGIAGSGKSAIVSELSRRHELVRAVHRCRFDDSASLPARNVLCNLSYFLSCNDKQYTERILREDIDKVDEWEEAKLFEKLFIRPLEEVKKNFALVIDGIDEMELSQARKLIGMLSDGAGRIPHAKFILTVRSEERFAALYKSLPLLELTKERNLRAARIMAEAELGKRGICTPGLLERLLTASEGNFLYLSMLFDDYDLNKFDISRNVDFPLGLNRLYLNALPRQFPNEELYRTNDAPVLSLLCAVKRPLTREELCALTGKSEIELNGILRGLRYLVKAEAGRYSIYHRSMEEFLKSADSQEYQIDPGTGDKAIVAITKSMTRAERERYAYLKELLFVHIFRMSDADYADKLYEEERDRASINAAKSVFSLEETELARAASVIAAMRTGRHWR